MGKITAGENVTVKSIISMVKQSKIDKFDTCQIYVQDIIVGREPTGKKELVIEYEEIEDTILNKNW